MRREWLRKSVVTGRGGLFFLCFMIFFGTLGPMAWAVVSPYGNNAPSSFADLADQVKDSVVNISTTQVIKGHPLQPFLNPDSPFREFFGDDFFKRFFGDVPQGKMKTHSLGSGVVIDEEGLILTNNHVVDKADEIKIKLQNGKEYDAKVVGRDSKTDLALIKVKPDEDFPKAAPLGNSDALRVGDWVMAVGNPFGLGHTVTVGIISAKGRIIGAGPYDDFLQTDAAINPGNSGGPLFNMRGEVVGINTAIVARGQGIGFAIPINMAKELLPQLKSGKVIRGWLGVMIQDITPELAESFGLKESKGVLISDVIEDSPADKAGLETGDIVVEFNGEPVENAHQLSRKVASTRPETTVKIGILRDGSRKTIQLRLGTMPEEGVSEPPSVEKTSWGMSVQNLTEELASRFGWDVSERGVIITEVEPGSPAAEARLRPGDLIKEVNRKKIQNLRDYNQALKKGKKKRSLLLLIKRGDHTFYVVLQAQEE
ncbi:serine protease Do [Desulfacinum hydrothermale DSM 13146]|uniref:Probable periplasmic serine endoprotease DegP-like n=1 Tax=Desulfacinum hydrothermale DSM 13146 TaxID=1121390 RepID=A0A1W1XSX1_9BACT|nr:DegQ family serine endoprotease [Desulfacinum hydrothermale]SMC26935.1 serine protease Do [Desulfacinum hydrothermale DSM 13146]